MSESVKKRSSKAGLPPGTIVHIGEQRTAEVKITVVDYDETHFQEKELRVVEECFPYKETPTVTWINVEGIHDIEVLEKIGSCFGLHPLVMEDISNTDQRPKTEDYDNYIYVVLKMLYYNCKNSHDRVVPEQISLILGKNFVLSFQEGIKGDVFDSVRERIRNDKGRIRKMGPDYLAYTLIDAVVDSYFLILERLGERIEELEEILVTNPATESLRDIHILKRDMIVLRRSIWPLREVVGSLERGESALIKEVTTIYLRDVYDHAIQVIDSIETYRDTLSGMLDIYLSSTSNRLNEVVKVLTIISTIFIPLTFIVGVYGMNFRYMPELSHPLGYPMVWIFMIGILAGMILYFKKKKWI
ncbi:MAG: magnesium/cobalt transporter CorA [Actinomycetota bacterium]